MADALCGPSNSLQTFQKHTSVDRTLQQDRITSRHLPTEEFRSTSGHNAGILDAEFEAFQAGRSVGNPFPELQPFAYGSNAAFVPSGSLNPTQQPNWASDFQKLHISSPQPSHAPQLQFQQHAPQVSSASGAWYQDFMWQQSQSSAQPQHTQLGPQTRGGGSYMHHGNRYDNTLQTFGQQHSLLSEPPLQAESSRQADDFVDDTAFERAFDAAHSRIQQLDDHTQQEEVQVSPDMRMQELPEPVPSTAPWDEIHRVGSDRILDEPLEEKQEHEGKNDADELARTAGQLLDNLKHDHSQKFQESSFLSLMRQLRDREVRVEGDKLVQASQPLHPGGQFYPVGTKSNGKSIAEGAQNTFDRNEHLSAEMGSLMEQQIQSREKAMALEKARSQMQYIYTQRKENLEKMKRVREKTFNHYDVPSDLSVNTPFAPPMASERFMARQDNTTQPGQIESQAQHLRQEYQRLFGPDTELLVPPGSASESQQKPDMPNHALQDYKMQLKLPGQEEVRSLRDARREAEQLERANEEREEGIIE